MTPSMLMFCRVNLTKKYGVLCQIFGGEEKTEPCMDLLRHAFNGTEKKSLKRLGSNQKRPTLDRNC